MTDRDVVKIALTFLAAVAGFLAVYAGPELSPAARLVAAAIVAGCAPALALLDPPGKKAAKVNPDKLTAAQARQVADELERRMKRTPADAEPHG